jgi:prepilin-type N-terminal cleavage/methylation domain-containing protein
MNKKTAYSKGYTLLEVMIGLAVFVTVVIPLTSFLFKDLFFAKYQDKVTAFCLLDQEIKKAQVFPGAMCSLKRLNVASQDWEIRSETSGSGLMKCKFTAMKNKIIYGEFWVMIYK